MVGTDVRGQVGEGTDPGQDALASARAEGLSIRALAVAVRLSSSRVHQIVTADQRPVLDQLVFVQHTRHGCGPPGGQARLPSPPRIHRNTDST